MSTVLVSDAPLPVCILLATYNGERFLPQQLDSILAQDHGNWVLLVSDDGSSDQTLAIIDQYAKRDSRIRHLPGAPDGPMGAKNNFAYLMQQGLAVEADCWLFCDQDDVWRDDKIQRMRAAFGDLQGPALVYSAVTVVDEKLHVMPEAGFQQIGCAEWGDGFLSLNTVPGCSMAMNRDLLALATPLPQEALMHDWWCALLAYSHGKLVRIDAPLLHYRQHDSNAVGGAAIGHMLRSPMSGWRRGGAELKRSFHQAMAASSRLCERGATDMRIERLDSYGQIPTASRVDRLRVMERLGLRSGMGVARWVLKLRLLLAGASLSDPSPSSLNSIGQSSPGRGD